MENIKTHQDTLRKIYGSTAEIKSVRPMTGGDIICVRLFRIASGELSVIFSASCEMSQRDKSNKGSHHFSIGLPDRE
jgi:hypothetical protein